MKNVVRFAVAGALLAGYATAQAQSLPSTNASDLWLFVSDQAAGTTFAEDTGVSVSSLMPSGSLAAGGSNTVLSTAIKASINVGPTSALTAYINAANAAGHTLEWGVDGANFPGTTSAKGTQKPGGILGITDNPVSQESTTAGLIFGNLQTFAGGLENDLQGFVVPGAGTQAAYTAGGQTYKFSLGSSAGNVWGASTGNNAGSTNMYGQGPDQAGIGLGQNAAIYGLTGNANNGGQVQSYLLGETLTLKADGTLTTGSTVVTPIPAAVWLLGSGLLGLIGVGRRRAAAV